MSIACLVLNEHTEEPRVQNCGFN